jgi:2-dehydropantoate 2-reductase
MHVALIGAGAVGSVLGSLLWRAGEDVVLVGRAAQVAAIRAAGLNVEGVLGGFNAMPHAEERLVSRPDLALLTVKTQDVVTALRDNAAMLEGVPIVVLQNGLAGEALAATVVPAHQIVSGVVSLHAQYLVPGHVVLMQSDGLLIGRPDGDNDETVERIRRVLDRAVPTSTTANIRGARWTKLIVNLNNVLPALTNLSFRQVYHEPLLRRFAVGLMREGIAVAQAAGIRLEALAGTPVPLIRLVRYLPAALAGTVAARKAAKLETHWPLKGSMWQSIARARPSEIEYLNGEIVRAGREAGVPTPLNEAAVTLLRRVETERRYLSANEIEHTLRGEKLPERVRRQLRLCS